MKSLLTLLTAFFITSTAALYGADPAGNEKSGEPSKPLSHTGTAAPGELAPFTPQADLKGNWNFTADPRLPNVLIIGDSISIGYTRMVRKKLSDKANVYRPMNGKGPDNCGDTSIGLVKIDAWLGKQKWDVIHFNWGLWDLCYRNPASTSQGHRDKVGGKISTTPADYEKNLDQLVTRLEATGAKLIWASTTIVPPDEVGRVVGDDVKYNDIAAHVMAKHHIPTDDLYTLTKGFAGKFSEKPGDVHYKAQGYDALATQVSESIAKVLPKLPTPSK